MTRSRCLCGAVTWDAEGPFQFMSHCHCSRCRKAHGTPFATYVAASASGFRSSGREGVGRWESSPGFFRYFCTRCGSVVPGDPWQGLVFLPAGCLEEDPGARPEAHIFVASRASWFEIRDSLPRFDAYPPGLDAPAQPDRPPPDPPGPAPRGSCLCGGVAYVVEGQPLRARNCHCSRCRKARGAAHASNLVTSVDGVRFTRGVEGVASYKVPEAQFFTQTFCRTCGGPVPRIDRERNFAIVPMGTLDDDPGMRPQAHIFVGSKAPWYEIQDELPKYAEYAPAT
ncbi:MAG: GFA family protein [Deltaproteobacteria bacterium]|nr:MAG: GFA family protein [Deltaproteobacteria bacterium]